jgi:outer membrane protein
MNNSTLTNIILGVLGVAVAVLFFLHFKSASPSVKLNPTAKDMASAEGSKVAFVNIDTFFSKYVEYKKFKAEIEASQKASKKQLETKAGSLQNEYAKIMQQAQSGQISQQQAQSQMGSLQSRMGALQSEEQNMAKNLADKMDKATKDLYKKVDEYFNENKSKYNCDVVMGYTTNGMILYFDKNRDITNELVEDLNKN